MSICEHCRADFEPLEQSKGRFCSLQCTGLSRRRDIEPELLMPHVEAGASMTKIAEALKVTRGFVRDVMRRRGVYRAWCEQRYKKCASPKAGSSSATSASATAISPSAASVPLMAGGTSCGS